MLSKNEEEPSNWHKYTFQSLLWWKMLSKNHRTQ